MSKHLFNRNDFFFAYLIAGSSYCGYFFVKQLIKDIRKFKRFHELFNWHNSQGGCLPDVRGLVVLEGTARKIYERTNNLVDSEIIISKSNSWYIENFMVDCLNKANKNVSFLIQPNQNTKMFSLPRRFNSKLTMRSIWKRLFKYKSEIISSGDHLFLIGKVITNKNDLVPYSSDVFQVKPYMITEHSLVDLKNECLSVFPIVKTSTKLLLAACLCFYGLLHFKNCIQDYYSRRKRRAGILCSQCNTEPCNILCEKCENLTEYCSVCYLSLQNKINTKEIQMDDINCLHCHKVLDVVQKLIV